MRAPVQAPPLRRYSRRLSYACGSKRRRRQPVEIERQQRLWRRAIAAGGGGDVVSLTRRQRRREVHPREHRRGREPRRAALPSVDVGRLEQLLPHVRQRVQRSVEREPGVSDFFERPRDVLDGPRDTWRNSSTASRTRVTSARRARPAPCGSRSAGKRWRCGRRTLRWRAGSR